MDMTPYTGRVRLTCFRDICAAGKARIDAECVTCSACDVFILDLEGKVLIEIPLQEGTSSLDRARDRELVERQRAPTIDTAPEPEPKAAVTPRPDSVGAGLKPARKKED
jgi:hypothetical protein